MYHVDVFVADDPESNRAEFMYAADIQEQFPILYELVCEQDDFIQLQMVVGVTRVTVVAVGENYE